ncbi:MAG TPA: hypothetical protein VF478_07565, partial [Anaerolineae bacterium]
MVMLATAIMIVASFAIIAYPYFKTSRELDVSFASATDPVVETLVVQRDATYAAIKDLEFDHAMSKLSDVDYKSLRSKYEAKAVGILQELDSMTAARKRNPRMTLTDESIEAQVHQLRGGAAKVAMCVKCGVRALPSDL